MQGARTAAGLLAGTALLDILINLPGLALESPVPSLLLPSLDLLIVLAVLLTAARSNPGIRRGFALGVSIVLALAVGSRAYLRWGSPHAVSLLILGVAVAGAGVGAYFLCQLVLRGFSDTIPRNLFLLVAASCAIIQALLGIRIFSSSGFPGLVRAFGGFT